MPPAREMAAHLLQMVSRGDIEVRLMPDRFTTAISERPAVSALTRLECQTPGLITSRRHTMFRADDLTRLVTSQLDGTKTTGDLVALLEKLVEDGKLNVKGPENRPVDMHQVHVITVHKMLEQLRTQSLLIG